VAKQDRQLQSHLHGALNVGATQEQVAGALVALEGLLTPAELKRDLAMLARIAGR
jgi:4-carboxymuconolactone decarboxylase